jgi:hypothetical protein
MPSAFDAIFQTTAQPAMTSIFGGLVKLLRGRVSSGEFTACYSVREHVVEAEDGLTTSISLRTWEIPKASAVISGQDVTPRRGDRIEEVGSGEVWEIVPIDGKRPAVELDEGNYQWLAHSKRVTKET